MNWLRRLFYKKEQVFVYAQDKVLDSDGEKELKNQVMAEIEKSLRFLFWRKPIAYIDYYTNPKSLITYTILTTFEPRSKKMFTPFLFDLYAFAQLGDERILADYGLEKKEFSNEFQSIQLFKFRL